MYRRVVAAAAVLLLVAGCAAPGTVSGPAGDAEAPAGSTEVAPEGRTASGSDGAADAVAAQREVVRTAAVSLVADDPVTTGDDIAAIAVAAEGYVAAVGSGDGGCTAGSADDPTPPSCSSGGSPASDQQVTITIRVPAAAYDDAVAQIRALGDVRSVSVNADDVTGAAVDLKARIKAQQASVDRLATLMKRAETVADVVAIEKELARRQETLESLQAQQRRLADAVALATITTTVLTPARADSVAPPEPQWWNEPWETFWRTWGQLLVIAAAVSPLVIIGGAIAWLVLWLRRRSRRRRPAAAEPTAAAPAAAEPEA